MTRFTDRILAGFTAGGCIATLLLVPGLVGSAQAQTSSEPADSTTEPQTTSPNDGTVDPNPDSTTTETPTTDTPTSETPASPDTSPRFTCQVNNGQYTVMYSPESQPGQVYPWAVPQDMGSAWPAARRCDEISARLESYRPDGLQELQTAVENGYSTVCVTTEAVPSCRIVFTVPPGQDATWTRDQVFGNLASADQGTQTQGVNTFAEGRSPIGGSIGQILGQITGQPASTSPNGINLKPFLDTADGGTGTQLTGGSTSGRALNPDSFR